MLAFWSLSKKKIKKLFFTHIAGNGFLSTNQYAFRLRLHRHKICQLPLKSFFMNRSKFEDYSKNQTNQIKI